MNEIFINKHIKLKKLKEKDINENYLSWFKDVAINANLVNVNYKSVDQLKRYFSKTIKKKNLYFFGIFFKGKHIGNIKFENIYINSSKASWGILVGDKNFRGKRVGYHVLSKSMDFIEKKFKIKNFIISVTHKNKIARKLYFNLGFRQFRTQNNKIFMKKNCISSKIILGTANFGNIYGLNQSHIKSFETKSILDFAKNKGINFLDTANVYGNSEKTLGMSKLDSFEIISKFSKIYSQKNIKKFIHDQLKMTLKKTKKKSLYGYLIHNPNDLFIKKKNILKTLIGLKKLKKIKKIGISVYEVEELKKILTFFRPDIVQLPISILNQSFLKNNFLKKLKKLDIEIHVRSIFLQGLLLEKKPSNMSEILRTKLKKIDKICKIMRITRLKYLVSFIKGIHEIDKVVVGIDSIAQLKKIVKSMENPIIINNYKRLAVSDKRIIDPRLW